MSSSQMSENSIYQCRPIGSRQAIRALKKGESINRAQERLNEYIAQSYTPEKQCLYDRAISWSKADIMDYKSRFILIPIPFCLKPKQIVLRIPQGANEHLWWKIVDTGAALVSLYEYSNRVGIDSLPNIDFLSQGRLVYKTLDDMTYDEKKQYKMRYTKKGIWKYKKDYIRDLNLNGRTKKAFKILSNGLEEIQNPIIEIINSMREILEASDQRYKRLESNIRYEIVFSLCLIFNSIVTQIELPTIEEFLQLLEAGTHAESWTDIDFISRVMVTHKKDTRPTERGYKNLTENMSFNGLILPVFMLSIMEEPLKSYLTNVINSSVNVPSDCDGWDAVMAKGSICQDISSNSLYQNMVNFKSQICQNLPDLKTLIDNEFSKIEF